MLITLIFWNEPKRRLGESELVGQNVARKNNQNPFATKSKVLRTPDVSEIKKRNLVNLSTRKSDEKFEVLHDLAGNGKTIVARTPLKDICIEPSLQNFEEAKAPTEKIAAIVRSASPQQTIREPVRSSINIFKDFVLNTEEFLCSGEDNLIGLNESQIESENNSEENNFIGIDENQCENSDIDLLVPSSASPPSFLSVVAAESSQAGVESTPDDVEVEDFNNIPDNDLVSIESDLDQLNIDEVLQAFRDDAVAAEKAIEMATTCGRLHPKEFREYLQAFKSPESKHDAIHDTDAEWITSDNQSMFCFPRGENNLLPSFHRLESVTHNSPKSALLNLLEMADTPITKELKSETRHEDESELENENENESRSLMCFPIPPSSYSYSSPKEHSEVMSDKEVQGPPLSFKDRADAVRLVVAAAVASVSNIAMSTPSAVQPSDSIIPDNVPLHPVKSVMPPAPKMARVPLIVPTIVDIPDTMDFFDAQNPGEKSEVFNPKKVMARTPLKSGDSVLTYVPIMKDDSERVFFPENRNEIKMKRMSSDEINSNEIILNNCRPQQSERKRESISSSTGSTVWSPTELDRVAGVIRRVSISADCPSAQLIMGQLQVEINRLKKEVSSHHAMLTSAQEEKVCMAIRLEEV